MNSQDLRTLQEAYLEVYYELDEGRGDDLRTKHGHIESEKASIVAGIIMIVFLFMSFPCR